MNNVSLKALSKLLLLTLVINTSACGYFLYPERKGQNGGDLDPAVLILDAAALLFGVLPGVVAFAVDLTNGTIYLPKGGQSAIDKHRNKLTLIDEATLENLQSSLSSTGQQTTSRKTIAKQLSTLINQAVNPADLELYLTSRNTEQQNLPLAMLNPL